MSEYDYEGICDCGADIIGFITADKQNIDIFCVNCNYKNRIKATCYEDYEDYLGKDDLLSFWKVRNL